MSTIRIESGLGKRASFNVCEAIKVIGDESTMVECEINIPMIGTKYDKSLFFPYYTNEDAALEGIKNKFLSMIGSYLGNESDPDENILVHAAMIAQKIRYELAEAVRAALNEARKESLEG